MIFKLLMDKGPVRPKALERNINKYVCLKAPLKVFDRVYSFRPQICSDYKVVQLLWGGLHNIDLCNRNHRTFLKFIFLAKTYILAKITVHVIIPQKLSLFYSFL